MEQDATIPSNDITMSTHGKDEYPPAHTAEHILNATMVKMFGCPRSRINHIEKKKSKCNYTLVQQPTNEDIQAIEAEVNRVIARDLPVSCRMVPRDEVPDGIDLSRLPDEAGCLVRLVSIGDYDICLCAGAHVMHTSQIGAFRITSTSWNDKSTEDNFRIVFRLNTNE